MTKKVPLRTCTGCGSKKEKKSMIRIIRTPDGRIAIDTTGRQQGRGAYICPDPACLEKAYRKHSLARSLQMEIPPEIYEQLAERLAGLQKERETAAEEERETAEERKPAPEEERKTKEEPEAAEEKPESEEELKA